MVGAEVNQVEEDVREIRDRLKASYVQRTEFEPIKTVVFIFVGMITMGAVASIMAVLIQP